MSAAHTQVLGRNRDRAEKLCENCGRVFAKDTRNTWAYWARARFCSRECFGAYDGARKIANRPSIRDAFERWIDKEGVCWLWTGGSDAQGYGVLNYAGRQYRAARLALEFDGRPPLPSEYACHHCDNPPCVNPDHLYPGSPSDNVRDMRARGRGSWARRSTTKLNEERVREIRASSASNRELAERFGVTPSSISHVRQRKTWSHVT